MYNEGAFEKEEKEQKKRRKDSAIVYLDVLSKENKGCDCPDYSELEIALALMLGDSIDVLKEISDLLPKALQDDEKGVL